MFYYQHHIGDFIKDTSNLDDHQLATYMRMIWVYYTDEAPFDDAIEDIAFAVRSDEKTVRLLLKHFFSKDENKWHHKRCDREISEYHSKSEKARNSANARWKNANGMRTHSERNANECFFDANQEPITNNQKPINNKKKSTSVACPADVSSDCWDAFIAHRKAVKALVTDRVVNSIRNEADKAGIPLQDALDEVVARGWKGFKAEWYKPMIRNEQPRKTQYQLNQEATARALGLMPQRTFDGEVYDVETVTKFLG